MSYTISTAHCWCNYERIIVKIYFFEGIPFTFDELPKLARANPSVIQLANSGPRWDAEKMYRSSMYLMAEECHPMCFDLELENPELLPLD